ncbi:skin secretory protein xP2-like [Dreissena polymorpha]|uniref:skin secretory protein xP2-like n=1 Tax=Dreissena polymorpha TaxID=45954 RepID=UPI002263D306|nr:skin secretory protein xP2-like [Dreissena polymorpha]
MDCEGADYYAGFDPLFCSEEKLEIQEAVKMNPKHQSGAADATFYVEPELMVQVEKPAPASQLMEKPAPASQLMQKPAPASQLMQTQVEKPAPASQLMQKPAPASQLMQTQVEKPAPASQLMKKQAPASQLMQTEVEKPAPARRLMQTLKKKKSYLRIGDKVVAKRMRGKGDWLPAEISSKLKGGSIVQVRFVEDGAYMFVSKEDV